MEAPLVTIRPELDCDYAQREALLDRAFGRHRRRKTSQRLRDGRLPSPGLAFTAVDTQGRVAGTVRLWDVVAGSAGPAVLLGPLALPSRSVTIGYLIASSMVSARPLNLPMSR